MQIIRTRRGRQGSRSRRWVLSRGRQEQGKARGRGARGNGGKERVQEHVDPEYGDHESRKHEKNPTNRQKRGNLVPIQTRALLPNVILRRRKMDSS